MAGTRWLPLESNPEVMNKYVAALGVPTGKWQFTDVWGLDAELLMMVPRPVLAVVLLYPLTDKSESEKIGEESKSENLYFMKQTIGNACGTVGLVHALLNNTDQIELDGDKHLKKFYEATKELGPAEKAKYLEEDTAFGEAHEESAHEGQTQAPPREERLKCHFIAFVHNNGGLYELDGRKDSPVRHGDTTPDTLLEDATDVVKKFMARDPDELNFTVVALAAQG